MSKRTFFLAHTEARQGVAKFAMCAPDGLMVVFSEPTRNSDQNAKFHAICSDIAKSGMEWAGKKRTAAQWKVLLVSGHAVATKAEFEMVPGLEHEFVNLRESTALMSVKRSASLITYSLAFADLNGIELSEPRQLETA